MISKSIIANDRQARDVAAAIERIVQAQSSEQILRSVIEGLPHEVIDGVLRSLAAERSELEALLGAYSDAKEGNPDRLRERAGNDLGGLLVVARVSRGWSQKELARRLFLPEQQVQRYEAERYRSISLGSLIRVARTLGVRLTAELPTQFQEQWLPSYEMSQADAQKVLKHARVHGWLDKTNQTDESGLSQLKRTVAEHVSEHGTPSLLRTGLNVETHAQDWLLLAWKAQVTRRAISDLQRIKTRYNPLDISWLKDLVRLSAKSDGPSFVPAFLASHGIILICEPQIAGMNVDGAAFLIDDSPVIGLTLRHDRLDNFWFTLMHELAHVVVHYRTGLASGFFDNVDNPSIDEIEREANQFASNLLIPDELWIRSPARIAKSVEPIERLAEQLDISSAIIFGRIRLERNNYTIFSNKIGQGKVRKLLFREVSEGVA
ncbi:MAG: ImmA/IrrE family metallo-endopeptidase [Rhodospirillales bacterium]|nr:ImmA/IrrE family metallo-endopeptidase [Rhodospirillales bacterium]